MKLLTITTILGLLCLALPAYDGSVELDDTKRADLKQPR
jgi:hypothetical protein